ncbi:serine/threonine protein kinase [Salpingoeca rosetta]|uniref:non-specific serine/threonine protein kinase n=1 Tax=Salpingoeca rosetta (strain ATCC 50818 / BSB-021) TaxID=946362 RepID=F2UCR2_SALR5|nr:serine/threonine protein kinase [Salpingoeca rosetta]EGD74369.1 serine/threonine protein kinase [Salpingoeca rosetta]|eukprot:XP_004993269.1 serine/threonine protein kinase [Salpingoeca rosetta]
MENYDVIKRLGKGAQGSVFLVEDKRGAGKFVMKKVECNDEAEAEKAFKEALALETLSHEYICGYRELFVNWDREEATMFVCIVMDYYEAGVCLQLMPAHHSDARARARVCVVQKHFARVSIFTPRCDCVQVIHRDLKPSNLFMTNDLDIRLGDFGVATVMEGAKTKTRTTVGTMNYMAPEVLERPYNEKSDIWSLGCIVLDAATCGFLDHGQAQSLLFEVKHKPHRLEEALKEVERSYSKDLCQTIRTMLRRNFHQRPSAVELVQLPYIRSCLQLSQSALVEGQSTASHQTDVKPTTTKRIPNKLPEIAEFLETNFDRIGCQVAGLEEAANVAAATGPVPRGALVDRIHKAMNKFVNNIFVQIAGMECIKSLAAADEGEPEVRSEEVIKPVLIAMRSHPGSKELQKLACETIIAIASTEDYAQAIGQYGGVQDVLIALRDNVNDASIAEQACRALFSLTVCEENGMIIAEERGLEDVRSAMESFIDNPTFMTAAASVLWTLSAIDELVDAIVELKCISLMTVAMANHVENADLVRETLNALGSLVVDEMCAYAFCDRDESGDSLGAVDEAIQAHIKSAEICEAAVSLLAELAEHDDLRAMLVEGGAVEMLTRVKGAFPDDPEIGGKCEDGTALLAA